MPALPSRLRRASVATYSLATSWVTCGMQACSKPAHGARRLGCRTGCWRPEYAHARREVSAGLGPFVSNGRQLGFSLVVEFPARVRACTAPAVTAGRNSKTLRRGFRDQLGRPGFQPSGLQLGGQGDDAAVADREGCLHECRLAALQQRLSISEIKRDASRARVRDPDRSAPRPSSSRIGQSGRRSPWQQCTRCFQRAAWCGEFGDALGQVVHVPGRCVSRSRWSASGVPRASSSAISPMPKPGCARDEGSECTSRSSL